MTRYQKILIQVHAILENAGLLESRIGFTLYVKSYFFYKRFFEARRLISILDESFRLIQKEDFVFLDIGCHIGFVSSYVSKQKIHAAVISIDPDKRNIDKFKRILESKFTSQSLTLKNLAVWEFNGVIPFTFEDTNTADNKFNANSKNVIECLTLESLLDEKINCDILIKIDVQGYESEVLNGAVGVLKRNNVFLIIELDEKALTLRGSTSKELLDKLKSLGYCAWNNSERTFFGDQRLTDFLAHRACTDLLFVPRNMTDCRNNTNM